MTYNQAIYDVVLMLDYEIDFTERRRKRPNVTPSEDTRMVEQVRKMIVLQARIGSMVKGPETILPDTPLNIKMERPE
jgi:hypothetical protein